MMGEGDITFERNIPQMGVSKFYKVSHYENNKFDCISSLKFVSKYHIFTVHF